MARKKSIRDLQTQYRKIYSSLAQERRGLSPISKRYKQLTERIRGIGEIYERYEANIGKTKSYSEGFTKAQEQHNNIAAEKIFNKIDNRKYSQRTYMGRANG